MRKLTEEEIELRSPEIQELIGRTPNALIRLGSAAFLITILLILSMSALIKFPDKIPARAVITSRIPPSSFVSKTQGAIELLTKNGMVVKKGDVLAYIENGVPFDNIRYIIDNIELWKKVVYSDTINPQVSKYFRQGLNLGEMQVYYNKLIANILSLEIYNTTNKDLHLINSIDSRLKYYFELNKNLKRQEEIVRSDAQIFKKKFDVDSSLTVEKVIAPLDLDNSMLKYNNSLLAIEQSNKDYINNVIQISQLIQQKNEFEGKRSETLMNYVLTIRNDLAQLESALEEFKSRYFFVAPFDGVISFPRNIVSHQFVSVNENILTIIPNDNNLFCNAIVPVSGSGKIEVGQKVHLRIDNYSSEEYGFINGTVSNISLVPSDNTYLVEITLQSGLHTTYKKTLPFRQQMTATAEIITKDIHLIERIFNKFRSVAVNN